MMNFTGNAAMNLVCCLLLVMVCVPTAHSLYCWIEPKSESSRNAPLLLKPDVDEFASPAAGASNIRLSFCERMRVACPGGVITVFSRRLNTSETELRCLGLGLFDLPGTGYAAPLRRVFCDTRPEPVAVNTTEACVNGTLLHTGFQLQPNGFVNVVPRICYNETLGQTHWAESQLSSAAARGQRKRPVAAESDVGNGFRVGSFYTNNTNMGSGLYSAQNQRTRFATLLNSTSLAEQYIPTDGSQYLQVQQLAPSADMLYAAQREASRFFVNTLPVWRSVRSGNWRLIEDLLRKEAARQRADLELWTGGVDELTLPGADGNATLITLANDTNGNATQVPVPKFLFKVALDRVHNRGLVFVTLNNPHVRAITAAEQLCGTAYERCTTLYPQFNIAKLGYTQCCTLDQFAEIAGRVGLPAFPENVKPLF